MHIKIKPIFSLLLMTGIFFTQNVFANDTTINAHLSDTGPVMKINIDKASAPAGKIVFHATNDSKYKEHEMLIVKVKSFSDAMPLNKKTNRIDEEQIESIGEVEGLKPQETKEVSLDLKPGKYLLMCNKPDHFESGMFTSFIVY